MRAAHPDEHRVGARGLLLLGLGIAVAASNNRLAVKTHRGSRER